MVSLTNLWRKNLSAELAHDAVQRMQIPTECGSALEQLVSKFALFNLLENAYQSNLQVAGLGLARALEAEHALDLLTFASILISIIMGVYAGWQDVTYATKLKEEVVNADIDKELAEVLGLPADDETFAALVEVLKVGDWSGNEACVEFNRLLGSEASPEDCSKDSMRLLSRIFRDGYVKQKTISRTYAIFLALVALSALLSCRAAFQTSMVVICPTGLYDLGVGCLGLPANFTAAKPV